jgi:hypothetical protein
MGVAVRQVRLMVRKGTSYTALFPTVIGIGEQESRQNGLAMRQVRSIVQKRTNYLCSTVPTVIGIGEQESR